MHMEETMMAVVVFGLEHISNLQARSIRANFYLESQKSHHVEILGYYWLKSLLESIRRVL